MSDHAEMRAFIAACTANPDDTLPRLVFLDWLEEHGWEQAPRWRADVRAGRLSEPKLLPRPDTVLPDRVGRKVIAVPRWADEVSWPQPLVYFWGGLPDVLIVRSDQFLLAARTILPAYPLRRFIISDRLTQVRREAGQLGLHRLTFIRPAILLDRPLVLPSGERRTERVTYRHFARAAYEHDQLPDLVDQVANTITDPATNLNLFQPRSLILRESITKMVADPDLRELQFNLL